MPDAFRHQGIDFAIGTHGAHQCHRFGCDGKSKPRCEACAAQDAHRVFGERWADVPQHAGLQVGGAVKRVDQRAGLIQRDGHRIDGEIAPREVLLQADIGCRMKLKAGVTRCSLAFGAGECVFFVGLRMQEHRKIAAHRPETLVHQGFWRSADHHVIVIGDGQSEQLITHRPADAVDFHAYLAS